MKRARVLPAVTALVLAAAGCGHGTTRMGIPWWPQGPGNVEETAPDGREARAEAAPAAVPDPAARDGRATEVRTPAAPPEGATPGALPPARPASPPANDPVEPRAPARAYTQASRYGDLLFVSGQIPIDPRTGDFDPESPIEEQTRVVMENIREILESHRLTMANVVFVTVYLTALRDLPGMNAVYERYFRSSLPARSVVEVSRLPRGARLEISVVAGR